MTEKLQQSAESNENIDVGFETKDEIIDAQVEKSIEKRIEHEANVSSLRSAINLEQIASERDPEGYAQAIRVGLYQSQKVDTERNRLQHDIQFFSSRKQELDGHARHQAELYEKRSKKPLIRFKKFLHLKDRELQKTEQLQRSLEEESKHLTDTIQGLEERATTVDKNNTNDPISEYLEQFETPLSPAEKQKLLKFDALSELSTDEYMRLWKRLNPFFVTHVTRQGFRNHNSMPSHSAGMRTFHNGFTEMLNSDKELRSPYEVEYGIARQEPNEELVHKILQKELFSKDIDIESIRRTVRQRLEREGKTVNLSNKIAKVEEHLDYLKAMGDTKAIKWVKQDLADLAKLKKEEDANVDAEVVENLLREKMEIENGSALADPWADGMAIHFGQHSVLDSYYGGEQGNEIFIVYPTDVLVSQCLFGGHIRENLVAAEIEGDQSRNDLFVWSKDDAIPIDAGIAFLPKNVLVDRRTGSKYASKSELKNGTEALSIQKDEVKIAQFTEWIKNLTPDDIELFEKDRYQETLKKKLVQLGMNKDEIEKIELKDIVTFIENRHFGKLNEIESMNPDISDQEKTELSIRRFIDEKGLFDMLSNDAIPAEEYWEEYFRHNPEKRPKHLIYYDGDPTDAVKEFLQSHDILVPIDKIYINNPNTQQTFTGKSDRSKKDGKLLGFESHFIPDNHDAERTDARVQKHHAIFKDIAKRLIAEHYHLSL